MSDFFKELRDGMKESTSIMLGADQIEDHTPRRKIKGRRNMSSSSSSSLSIPESFDSSSDDETCELVIPVTSNTSQTMPPIPDSETNILRAEIAKTLQKLKPKLDAAKQRCDNLNRRERSRKNGKKSESESSSVSDENITAIETGLRKLKTNPISSEPTPIPVQGNLSPDSLLNNEFQKKKEKIQGNILQIHKKLMKMKMENNGAAPKTNLQNFSNNSMSSSNMSTISQKEDQPTRRRGVRGKPSAEAKKELKGDNVLILSLLALNHKERDDYLMKIAKERNLTESVGGKKKKSAIIRREYQDLAKKFRKNCLRHTYGHSAALHDLDLCDSDNSDIRPSIPVKQDAKEIKKESRTFEDEVSSLMCNGQSDKQWCLENTSKAAINSYSMEENIAELEKFVEKLVGAQLGYVIEGELRVNAKNNWQAFVTNSTRSDVFINSIIMRKCAMDGDIVRIFVKGNPLSEAAKSPDQITLNLSVNPNKAAASKKNNDGFVIKIVEKRNDRKCIGSFMSSSNDVKKMKFIPRDTKIPAMTINPQNLPEAFLNHELKDLKEILYQAEIIEWYNDEPIGSIVKSVGKCGELIAENLAIMLKNNLDPKPYTEEIINKLPKSPFQIPEKEYQTRRDMRSECVFTIDPLTARDLDDALSLKILKNGNFEIGVHISDVTYFLEECSELDEIVQLKATTIYMVDNVYHMLPKPLCLLCSLLPGEDKLAFSVFWEITRDATIVNTTYARTIINSCTQFAYEHAQQMLENKCKDFSPSDFPVIHHGYTPNYLASIVNQLQSIAVQLRQKRMDNGCLKINQPKLSFKLDPATGKPLAYSLYELKESNQMIEDFMLLANSSVAECIFKRFPNTSILRSHCPPTQAALDKLKVFLEAHGYAFNMETSKAIYESMEHLISSSEDPVATTAGINVLISKPMTRARYFCTENVTSEAEFTHYALSIPMYTHFTSPIRRYADVMVHRLLAAVQNYTDTPKRETEQLHSIASNCNLQKYNAKLADEESRRLYFMHYVLEHKQVEMRASILGIYLHNLEIVLIESGDVLKCMFQDLTKVAKFKFVEEQKTPIKHCLIIPADKSILPRQLKLFSMLNVVVVCKSNALKVISLLPHVKPTNLN